MNSPRPIEIVGGGLAGLSLGLALRRAGVPVVVFEAGHYPRHRVCGEFITGLAPETIARLGLGPHLEDALQHRQVAWFHGAEPTGIQKLPAPALGLSRHVLDARLATAFLAAGGDLRTATRLVDPIGKPGRVFATGRQASRSTWLGLKFHVRNIVLERDLELCLGEHAYVGLARVDRATVNVCGLFRRRPLAGRGPGLLLNYLRASGLAGLAGRLAQAEIDVTSCCAVAALAFDRAVRPSDRIQIGDASAMIPPFTGNGMAMAFQSAETVLDPLLAFARRESDWPATCRATHAALRSRFRRRLASASALHAFLLRPRRQRWLAALSRAHLLPFGPLYTILH